MIPKQEIYKRFLEQIFRDYKDKRIIMQKIKELDNKTDDELFSIIYKKQ